MHSLAEWENVNVGCVLTTCGESAELCGRRCGQRGVERVKRERLASESDILVAIIHTI